MNMENSELELLILTFCYRSHTSVLYSTSAGISCSSRSQLSKNCERKKNRTKKSVFFLSISERVGCLECCVTISKANAFRLYGGNARGDDVKTERYFL